MIRRAILLRSSVRVISQKRGMGAAEPVRKPQSSSSTTTGQPKAKKPPISEQFKDSFKQQEQKHQSQKEQKKTEETTASRFSQMISGFWDSAIVRDVSGTMKDTKRAIIDDNASRYGGMTSRSFRDKIKKQRMAGFEATQAAQTAEENPNAGANVVLHKDSKWKESWNRFKEGNPVVQGIFTMRRRYEESDSPMANTARFLSDRIQDIFGPVFQETEHAAALAEIKEMDPDFNVEDFMKDAREFMVPEVLDAYVDWDPKVLKEWCSDGVYNILEASRDPLVQEGLSIEGKILDLRNVELVMGKMMEDTPLLIMTFKTQQIEVVRDVKGEIVGGSEDMINNVYYIWALTKDASDKPNPLTKGWKIVEFAIQAVQESY